jgi:hypothetical protein
MGGDAVPEAHLPPPKPSSLTCQSVTSPTARWCRSGTGSRAASPAWRRRLTPSIPGRCAGSCSAPPVPFAQLRLRRARNVTPQVADAPPLRRVHAQLPQTAFAAPRCRASASPSPLQRRTLEQVLDLEPGAVLLDEHQLPMLVVALTLPRGPGRDCSVPLAGAGCVPDVDGRCRVQHRVGGRLVTAASRTVHGSSNPPNPPIINMIQPIKTLDTWIGWTAVKSIRPMGLSVRLSSDCWMVDAAVLHRPVHG